MRQLSPAQRRQSQAERARRLHDDVPAYRAEQDNERGHVLILDELIAARGERENRLRFQLFPQLVTFVISRRRPSGER